MALFGLPGFTEPYIGIMNYVIRRLRLIYSMTSKSLWTIVYFYSFIVKLSLIWCTPGKGVQGKWKHMATAVSDPDLTLEKTQCPWWDPAKHHIIGDLCATIKEKKLLPWLICIYTFSFIQEQSIELDEWIILMREGTVDIQITDFLSMGRVYRLAPLQCQWAGLCVRLWQHRLLCLKIPGGVEQCVGKMNYLNQVPMWAADEDLAASQLFIRTAYLKFKHEAQIPPWQLYTQVEWRIQFDGPRAVAYGQQLQGGTVAQCAGLVGETMLHCLRRREQTDTGRVRTSRDSRNNDRIGE